MLTRIVCSDFQPGTLLLDYFPILEQLPLWLQPWRKLAASLRTRESSLHVAFLRTLKKQVEAGVEPQCFGSELVKIQDAEDIDDDKAINILAMLIGAGADTTSSVLQSFFKVMALNPQALRNAQEGKFRSATRQYTCLLTTDART
jgi:cytochrome P450